MKKEKFKKIIIFLCIVLLMLIIVFSILVKKTNEEKVDIETPEDLIVVQEPRTIQDVLEKYDSKYISKEDKTLYVSFGKYLYSEDGKSNYDYFFSIIEELKPFFSSNFTVIDKEKDIKIRTNLEANYLFINDMKDFYEKTDGENYAKVQDIQIVKKTTMYINSPELEDIVMDSMFMKDSVLEKLGEPDEQQEDKDYTTYQDGKIKVSEYRASNHQIRNIIFSRDYEQSIMSGIEKDASLNDIYTKYPEMAFGSVEKGYLGYRTKDVYIFFYEDEVSVYGYSYKEKKDLNRYIREYLETKDLQLFKRRMVVTYDNFYEYKYDEENQNLYMLYPSLGLEIDIQNNNSNGIKIYQNYYVTEEIKKFVRDGKIQVESNVDLIDKVEKQRVSK